MGPRQGDIDPLIRQRPSQAKHRIFVSEAGPCGYGLYRDLRKKASDGWGGAPSLRPTKAGERVNTDRRAALQLARLARSGELPAVSGPKVHEAAIRALTRAREEASSDRQDAPFRLKAFWLRPEIRYTGRANGGPAHRRWRSEVVGPPPTPPIVFPEDVRAVPEHTERLPRREQELPEHVKAWRVFPVVEALPALRGVQCTGAVTLVAAMGALTRCDTPTELRTCLGLIPSEDSSGEQRRQGAIPPAGHTPARRVRVEGAWASRYPAQVRRQLPLRLATQPKIIQDIRWNAPVRRCQRSRRLVSRGTHAHGVTGAIARELAGFLGAMAREGPITP
jgi:transposase